MKILRSLASILIITFSLAVKGQEEKLLKNEIDLSFFSYEVNSETLNPWPNPKFIPGVNYNRYFSNWSWTTNLEFGRNSLTDDCPGCSDNFYGVGKMTEVIISGGLRYTFLKQRSHMLKPFVESDLYYSYVTYKGDFQGGFTGNGTKIDNSYNTFGISERAGLIFLPVQSLSLTVSLSLRLGTGTVKDNYLGSTGKYLSVTLTLIQLRLGYLF
jgi:hypothetical protein